MKVSYECQIASCYIKIQYSLNIVQPRYRLKMSYVDWKRDDQKAV